MIKMAIANAGAEANGNADDLLPATSINFIAITELTLPINREPVSPMNIRAGEKLKIKKANKLPASEKPTME